MNELWEDIKTFIIFLLVSPLILCVIILIIIVCVLEDLYYKFYK